VLPGVGARLHRIRAFGHDLLRTPPDPTEHLREPFFWGGYNMAPWCNRIAAGPIKVAGRTVDLESNFRDGSAIHGQVYEGPWDVVGEGAFGIEAGRDGWPWRYEVSFTVELDGRRLLMRQGLRNLDETPVPAGIGIHPWFVGSPLVAIRASHVYTSNSDSPPQPAPVSGVTDLREIGVMERGLDATWADLDEPAVELAWPDLGLRATMRSDATTLHVTAANPTDIEALAVEPQTHAPQGLRRVLRGEPGALTLLAPGDSLTQKIELTFETKVGD
jgi:aldose 1-epimerase